jgi:predicted amino acid dehydrogenase
VLPQRGRAETGKARRRTPKRKAERTDADKAVAQEEIQSFHAAGPEHVLLESQQLLPYTVKRNWRSFLAN